MEKIVINNVEYNCIETKKTGIFPNDYFYTIVDTNEYVRMKPNLDDITSIVAYDVDNFVKYNTTEYGTYSSIEYKDKTTTSYTINGEKVDAFLISFKRIDLENKVNQISEIVMPKIDEANMTLNEFKEYKKSQLDEICRRFIYEGKNIYTATYGTEHFTFKDEDQKDLMTYFIAAFLTKMPQYYHPSTIPPTPCKPYSYNEIIFIYLTLNAHLLYHMTYANQLYIMLYNCTTKDEVRAIEYGMELSSEANQIIQYALANCNATINMLNDLFTKDTGEWEELEDEDTDIAPVP